MSIHKDYNNIFNSVNSGTDLKHFEYKIIYMKIRILSAELHTTMFGYVKSFRPLIILRHEKIPYILYLEKTLVELINFIIEIFNIN